MIQLILEVYALLLFGIFVRGKDFLDDRYVGGTDGVVVTILEALSGENWVKGTISETEEGLRFPVVRYEYPLN
jgi:hypothetical protein